jgi:hypothetical protein
LGQFGCGFDFFTATSKLSHRCLLLDYVKWQSCGDRRIRRGESEISSRRSDGGALFSFSVFRWFHRQCLFLFLADAGCNDPSAMRMGVKIYHCGIS